MNDAIRIDEFPPNYIIRFFLYRRFPGGDGAAWWLTIRNQLLSAPHSLQADAGLGSLYVVIIVNIIGSAVRRRTREDVAHAKQVSKLIPNALYQQQPKQVPY